MTDDEFNIEDLQRRVEALEGDREERRTFERYGAVMNLVIISVMIGLVLRSCL